MNHGEDEALANGVPIAIAAIAVAAASRAAPTNVCPREAKESPLFITPPIVLLVVDRAPQARHLQDLRVARPG
jgi:hypothetical protein